MFLKYAHIPVQHHKKGLTMRLMEHLPHSDWSDVARTREIELVEKRFNIAISVAIAVGLTTIALQVQIMLSISHL
ncbi:unannotated protein [freshwater metagenome]|uniref:Unannotated protein n=1 Tax=freshwater metagenome TaxID=449393 RepID=A0A6J6N1P7_9ZZZZ